MRLVNVKKAKAKLSELVDQTAKGEPFIISKAGKPLVEGMGLPEPEPTRPRRTGFLAGQISVPDDFDRMCDGDATMLV